MGPDSRSRTETGTAGRIGRGALVLLVALSAGVAAAGPARATLLIVDVRTDYVPVEEFAGVRARLAPWPTPGFEQFQNRPAYSTIDFVAGTRAAEFEVPNGIYLVTVDLLDGDGEVVARHPRIVDLDTDFGYIEVIARPTGSAEKSVALEVDADGDGAISGGDTVRYSVVAMSAHGEGFVDELSPGLALVAGSVTTTHGVVVEGNTPGDTRVEIGAMDTSGGATTVVEFDALVLPQTENQGEFRLESAPLVPGDWAQNYNSRRIPTDDPSTLPAGDPTRTPVACGLASCEGELGECNDDLATCEAEREALEDQVAALEATLGEVMADPDADGLPALADSCPDSVPGEPVDDDGCTQAQFCARIDLSAPGGSNFCRHADWGGDEPLGNPHDCRPSGGICAPD